MASDADRPWPPVPPPGREPGSAQPTTRPPSTGPFESGQIVSGPAISIKPNEIEVDLGEGHVGVIGDRHYAENLKVDLTGEANEGDIVEGAGQ